MTRPPLRGVTIKAALLVGFSLTLGLWAFTGYDFARRMAAVEDESAAIAARYMQAQEQLAGVRAQVLLASVFVRDALLDPAPDEAGLYARQLEASYEAIDRALDGYEPVHGTPPERERLAQLRDEIDNFRTTTMNVLAAKRREPGADARTLLNREVVPRREAAVRVSEDVQALNRSAFIQHQTDITRLHRLAERQTWQRLGLALLGSLAIALLATVYAGHLESRLWRQMAENDRHTRALQHLSTRVIGAQELERRTIARELHDEVGQLLTAMKVELAMAQRAVDADRAAPGLLDEARTIADGALHTVRDLSQLLHPALLDDLGLAAAVDWQAATFTRRHGVPVHVAQEGLGERLPPETELAAYRIIQEALTNVARHARATRCDVRIRRLPSSLEIIIEDNGVGFEPVSVERGDPGRGLGLLGMRERATQLDGELSLHSTPGAGTRVHVRLPLHPAAAGASAPPTMVEARRA